MYTILLQCLAVCCTVLQCVAVVTRFNACTVRPRPIESLELQVISRQRATNYRALLRKITYKNKASSASLPPCTMPTSTFTHEEGKTKSYLKCVLSAVYVVLTTLSLVFLAACHILI